jgi:hypothetical protein
MGDRKPYPLARSGRIELDFHSSIVRYCPRIGDIAVSLHGNFQKVGDGQRVVRRTCPTCVARFKDQLSRFGLDQFYRVSIAGELQDRFIRPDNAIGRHSKPRGYDTILGLLRRGSVRYRARMSVPGFRDLYFVRMRRVETRYLPTPQRYDHELSRRMRHLRAVMIPHCQGVTWECPP